MGRKKIIGSIIKRLMVVSVTAAVMFAMTVFGVSAADNGQSGFSMPPQPGTTANSQSDSKTSAPEKVPVIDTTKADELRQPANALKENVLKSDLVTKGTQYDAAGLLTYSIQNGKATIMSCDPAVKGELYIPDYINGCPVTAINDFAFLYCANLTAVTLPATVTDIGDYAFCYCTQLASVTAGGTATSAITIGDHAFYRCPDLKKLDYGVIKEIGNYAFAYSGLSMTTFKNGLETIGAYAFEGCSGLTTVTLPDSLKTIGDFSFNSCANLKNVTFPSALADSGTGGYIFYNCTALTGITPSAAWTRVPDGIFASCPAADASSVLREGVTEIGSAAFARCKTVKGRLSIPSTVTRICSYAFYNTGSYGDAIKSVELPSGLKYIGKSAFESAEFGADGLKLPDTVEEIGASAFNGCQIEGELRLPAGLKKLGTAALGNNGITKVSIPAGIETVGNNALFSNKSLIDVTVAENSDVSGWGTGVFSYCVKLEHVKLPSSWTTLPAKTFSGCTALKSFDIPTSITSIGDDTFKDCASLKSISIPSGVTMIGAGAFYGSGIESVALPSKLEEIGKEAFKGSALTSVEIPSAVKTIGENAFKECLKLTSLRISAGSLTETGKGAFSGCTALKSASIGNGLETLGEETFKDCTALESITLPSTLKYIGDTTEFFYEHRAGSGSSCFEGCTSLRSVTLPEGLLFMGDKTFSDCKALSQIRIPSSVTLLGSDVFKNSGLERVTFAEGISSDFVCKTLAASPKFTGCSKLRYVNIPSNWKKIPQSLFKDCTGKLEITIPSNITEICGSAFENCTGLTSINIPSSVTVIGKNAFYNTGLTSITIPDSVTQENLGEYAIGACASLRTINLPKSWTCVPDGLFMNNTSLDSYTIPDNFTAIGKSAFSGSSLKSVIIPESITSIGDSAFSKCKQLTSVTLPSQLQSIGSNAFDGCSALTELKVPGSVKEIMPFAFASCDSLTNVVIQSGVESIDGLAFGFCANLRQVTVPDSVKNVAFSAFYGGTPGAVTLNCSKDSAADKHAQAVLYLNSTYHKQRSDIKILNINTREQFDNGGGISYHGPDTYGVEFNGLKYTVETNKGDNAAAGGWRKNYSTRFTAKVEGVADGFSAGNVVIDDYLAGSSVPITDIDSSAFKGQNSIKSVKLGANVQYMYTSAFADCKNLTTVDMGESSLKKVGNISSAFEGCTSLTTIIWPKVLEEITTSAFKGCTSLKSLDFTGTNLQYIYQNAFEGCTSLTSLKLREGFKWLDDYAFKGTGIKNAYLPASTELLQPTAFDSGRTTYHFTGDATNIDYYWLDDSNQMHFEPVLPQLLEYVSARVGQFYGKGLDNQSNYFISTGTAGLNVPYGMQSASVVFGEMGVPIGDTASELDGDLSTQASGETVPDSIQPEAESQQEQVETVPEKVYEVVRKKVTENPWMLGLAGLIAAALAALGGFRRYRKNR